MGLARTPSRGNQGRRLYVHVTSICDSTNRNAFDGIARNRFIYQSRVFCRNHPRAFCRNGVWFFLLCSFRGDKPEKRFHSLGSETHAFVCNFQFQFFIFLISHHSRLLSKNGIPDEFCTDQLMACSQQWRFHLLFLFAFRFIL